MKFEYDCIVVKVVVIFISNWCIYCGGLFYEGIVLSYVVYYFVGFWVWDIWCFFVVLVKFDLEFVKDNICVMFDY